MQDSLEYIKKIRFRMKLYFVLTIVFLCSTLVFALAWVDLVQFIKSIS